MLYAELQDQCIVRMGLDTTSTFITEKMVRDWLNEAHLWATAYKKWPFTEYMDMSGTFVTGGQEWDYPNINFKTDSIRSLLIGTDVRAMRVFEKKLFTDYLKYITDYPFGTDKIFSDYGRTLFINPNCASGTIVCFGQLTPPTLGLVSASTASTVFNGYDPEGDDAIIDKVCSYASRRMKKFGDAADYENRARTTLEELWKRVQDEQALYQTKDRALFERLNLLDDNDYENPLQF